MTDETLRGVLDRERVVVVGCSTTPGKDAHEVPKYLLANGYDVVPVNPYADEVLGREAYDSLSTVPGEATVVDVFRPSDEVAGIVEEAVDRGDVAALWLQRGVRDDEAAARARGADIQVVQDRCLRSEHQRLG